jgi:NAD(P)-dependent dehydrogenase (short-subunit alcohol dehydrogenase family)
MRNRRAGLKMYGQPFAQSGKFWTMLLANALLADEKLTATRTFGVLLGIAGTAVMVGPGLLANLGGPVWAKLALIGTALSYACAGVFARRFRTLRPELVATGQLTASTIVMIPVVLLDPPGGGEQQVTAIPESAKAAVDAIMASVALEYGPRGVRSNVIAPGGIKDTEGLARLGSSEAGSQERFEKAVPLGRLGLVRDVADATVYLFSEAGDYINGQVLAVDGGAWRRQGDMGTGLDVGMKYPDFLLSGQFSQHLKTARNTDKAKL